jgi:hypothetical protein
VARQFKRAASVTIARPQTGLYHAFLPNAVTVKDLRVQFSVAKDLKPEPNRGQIIISNLSANTRAEFQTKPLHVQLHAGYENNLKQLFRGDVRWSRSVMATPDWETQIELGDGERALKFARSTRSFAPGVTQKTVLKELASSMGLTWPNSIDDAQQVFKDYQTGTELSGKTADEISRILAPHDMTWSIQDGQLQLLEKMGVRQDQAHVISEDSGMIGSPEYGVPNAKGEPPVMTVTNLLYPEIMAGGKIEVRCRAFTGLFRVVRVIHNGDTHGDNWYTTIEGQPL